MRADTTHDRPDLAFVAVVAIAARTGFLAIPAVAAGHEQIRPLRRREARLKTGRELLPAIERRILARVVLVVQPVVLAHQVGMPTLREATLDRGRSVKTLTVTPNAAAIAGIQAVVLGDVGITLGQGQRPAALAGLRRRPVVLQRFAKAVLAHLVAIFAVGVVAIPERTDERPTIALPVEIRARANHEDVVVRRMLRRIDVRVVRVGKGHVRLDRQMVVEEAKTCRLVGNAFSCHGQGR